MEKHHQPVVEPAQQVDILIGLGRTTFELHAALLTAADTVDTYPAEERYDYLHTLADKSRLVTGVQHLPGGSFPAGTGAEAYILDKVFKIPGIASQPERIAATYQRLFVALRSDLANLPPRTPYQASAINRRRDQTQANLQQAAHAVLELTEESDDTHLLRTQAHNVLRPTVRTRIQTLRLATDYL
jgi:hypothetical protein